MRMTTLIRRTISFMCLFYVGTQGILTQTPAEEIVGLLNNTVQLNCRTDLNRPINWEFSPYGSTRYTWIYLNSLITEAEEARYKIESSNGNYRLIIQSLDWSYAGKYKCTDDAGLGQSAIAQLTVIDPRPRCFQNSSSGQSTLLPCLSGGLLCSVVYLGDTMPTLNLSKHVVERNIAADHQNAKRINFTLKQSCEKTNQETEVTNISTSDICHASVWLMHYAADETSVRTDEAVTTIYKVTLSHSTNIELLSFTTPIPAKIMFHSEQNSRDMTSKASCLADGTTFGVAVSLAVLGIGTSIFLSVYIAHLKRIITNLKVGSDGSASAHPSSGITPTENSRYELVEGDFIDASAGATHDGDYDALGQHGHYKPSLYDRLRVSKQSTNRGKILPFPKEEEESQASAGASCDPNTTEEVSRRRSQGKDSYLMLVQ